MKGIQTNGETEKSLDAYVLILNWNGWKDTIDCLQSIYTNIHENIQIVIVDNASTDGSVEKIENAIKTGTIISSGIGNPGEISLAIYSQYEFEQDQNFQAEQNNNAPIAGKVHPTVIIKSDKNGGFAAGNNIGIRYILAKSDAPFVWLLNNDTTVEPESLSALLHKAGANSKTGFVGSVIMNAATGRTECYGGGRFYPWLGRSRLYFKNKPIDAVTSAQERRLTYLMGGSLLIPLTCIRDVGLLDEGYFLYCEEKDWQTRAKMKGWQLHVATGSIVHHKGSASTRGLRHLYYYHLSRSTIIYLRKHHGTLTAMVASVLLLCICLVQNSSKLTNVFHAWRGIRWAWANK